MKVYKNINTSNHHI